MADRDNLSPMSFGRASAKPQEPMPKKKATSSTPEMVTVGDYIITWEEYEQRLSHMPLSGDRVFCLTMQNKAAVQPLVRELLDDDYAEVLEVRTQETFDFVSKKLADTNFITLDVVVRTTSGEIVNIELQKRNDGRGPVVDRAWIYAAAIATMSQVGKGTSKYHITRTLVCFLCGYSWRQGAGPEEHIVLYNETARRRATDKLEIVMVRYDQFSSLQAGFLRSLCSELAEHPDGSDYAKLLRDTVNEVANMYENKEEVKQDMAMTFEEAVSLREKGAFMSVAAVFATRVLRGTLSFNEAVSMLVQSSGMSEDEVSDMINSAMS